MTDLLLPGENCLVYGPTGGGKTTQLKKLIEAQATKEKPARVYAMKEPSTLSLLRPLQDKGLCEIEAYHPQFDAFLWIDNACAARIYREGKWIDGHPEHLAMVVYEGASSASDLILNALGVQAANGNNVGGEPAPGLKINAGGQSIMVPSGSRTHYLVAQRWLLGKVWDAQLLPCPQVWTAHEDIVGLDKKMADGTKEKEIAASLGIRGVIGPQFAGSALTANVPKYFVFTFRTRVITAEGSKRHQLLTGRHKDGDLEGIANARVDVPLIYEPCDIVKVLTDIRGKMK